jgi:hypothetical protein
MATKFFRVEAQVGGPGSYWTKIEVTSDGDYARAIYDQFKRAKVPVRLIEEEEKRRVRA